MFEGEGTDGVGDGNGGVGFCAEFDLGAGDGGAGRIVNSAFDSDALGVEGCCGKEHDEGEEGCDG